MHIKQARAPIGRGLWDHSFKQNNPPALAAEAKQRDNNILAFPHTPIPSPNRARISKVFGEAAPPFPAAAASGVEDEVEPSCADLAAAAAARPGCP